MECLAGDLGLLQNAPQRRLTAPDTSLLACVRGPPRTIPMVIEIRRAEEIASVTEAMRARSRLPEFKR
jgi:hypothetical protein